METRVLEWLRRRARALRWAAWLGVTAACGSSRAHDARAEATGEYELAELRYQASPGSVMLPELAEDLGYLAPLKLNCVGSTISGPQDIQATVTGDVDFGVAFNGAIVNLIAARAPIVSVVGVSFIDEQNFNGFFVRDDSPIRSARDLIGKKVAMNTVGAHSEFMLKEWLRRQGLTPAEIKQVTLLVIPPLNAEQTLREKQVDVAVLGALSRLKALERGGLRPLFTDYQLFGHLTSASYVLKRDFVRTKPKAARKFVEATARAIEWTRTTPRDVVIERMRRIVLARKRGEDPRLLDYWHASKADVPGGVMQAAEFQIWIDWLVKDGQLRKGRVDVNDLFTNAFNPYAAHES